MSLVRLENLRKEYLMADELVAALRGLDLDVPEGQYLAVMGPSGSGKSTLLNVLGCLDRPSDGHYYLGGEDVSGFNDSQLSEVRNRRIGFIFQSFNLVSQLTVLENIEVPLFYMGMPRRQRRARAMELANRVGLSHRVSHRPNQLSGGQQQRVAIGRSLANNPLLLLADEPTGNLDTHTTAEILAIFRELNDSGKTIIMITHEDDVARHAQRTVRLRDGVVEYDSAAT